MSEIKSIYKQMFQSLTGAALGLLTVVSDRLTIRFTDLWSDTDGKSKSYFFWFREEDLRGPVLRGSVSAVPLAWLAVELHR